MFSLAHKVACQLNDFEILCIIMQKFSLEEQRF